VGQRYVGSVMHFSDVIPTLIPTCLGKSDLENYLSAIDGVVLTGGRANIEPHHFDGNKFPEDEHIDPDRDRTALGLIDACVKREMPIFGICRGIQEINVAYGGTLFYRVHQVAGKHDHRMPKDEDVPVEEIFKPRQMISFTEKSLFKSLIKQDSFLVNTLHGQGIDQLGQGLNVEAYAQDGLIEAISIAGYPTFGIGIQWHAEFYPEKDENYLNKVLFQKFGESCWAYRAKK
jgi:putative glutamine amidotransferase